MSFLQPLEHRITSKLNDRVRAPLRIARRQYGSQEDHSSITQQLQASSHGGRESAIIDYTPFPRIENLHTLHAMLLAIGRPESVIFLARKGVADEMIAARLSDFGSVLCYDEQGAVVSVHPPGSSYGTAVVLRDLLTEGNIKKTRQRIAAARLRSILACGVIRPSPTSSLKCRDIGGTPYFEMPNGMLINCYISVKQIAGQRNNLLLLAYEVTCALYEYFFPRTERDKPCDHIVVTNNTALMIGATVQLISGIPICVVDKLGPVPSDSFQAMQASAHLANERVCLLAEVTATGNEIDRGVMYLLLQPAQIGSVIVCYNLQVGRSLLSRNLNAIDLCQPKQDLGYVYRSG